MMLKCRNLSKSYLVANEKVMVLDKINLSLAKGKSMAIIGASGSGKSTLLHVLSGLLNADSGTVQTSDFIKDFNIPSKAEVNPYASIVFQRHHLIMELSVFENVALPLKIRKASNIKPLVLKAIEAVGLSNFTDYYPNMLSGGQRQRVAIARAIVTSPKLLIADEPTGNLDSDNALMIRELLFELQAKNNMSLLIATHDELFVNDVNSLLHVKNGFLVSA